MLAQWGNTSAYFNGELIAGANTSGNPVVIDHLSLELGVGSPVGVCGICYGQFRPIAPSPGILYQTVAVWSYGADTGCENHQANGPPAAGDDNAAEFTTLSLPCVVAVSNRTR